MRWKNAGLTVVLLVCAAMIVLELELPPQYCPRGSWLLSLGETVGVQRCPSKGWLAVCALGLLVLVAPVVHDGGYAWQRVALLLLAAMACGCMVVDLVPSPRESQAAILSPVAWLRLTLTFASVVVIGKLGLLHRFAAFHRSKPVRTNDDLAGLLPFQRRDLQRLSAAIHASDRNEPGRVIQFIGRWGDGKSFLLERLEKFLNQSPGTQRASTPPSDPCAVVIVNVWHQESEPDLYLAVVEDLLGHRDYWYRYGWLHYPLWLLVQRFVKEAKLALSAGKDLAAKLELPLASPRPTGQRTLVRLASRVLRQGRRTVIVLDEIDRATPPVAQAALTLARRSLGLPGVVIILSYVDDLIRYKAFNPLIDGLSDINSTMRADIFSQTIDADGKPIRGARRTVVG